MFKLKRPCKDCPFKKDLGRTFRLPRTRIDEIVQAPAFQCHKTVDYLDDDTTAQGDKPQQCAGLMTVLHRENRHNQIMQVAERLTDFDPDLLDPDNEAYESLDALYRDHCGDDQ